MITGEPRYLSASWRRRVEVAADVWWRLWRRAGWSRRDAYLAAAEEVLPVSVHAPAAAGGTLRRRAAEYERSRHVERTIDAITAGQDTT